MFNLKDRFVLSCARNLPSAYNSNNTAVSPCEISERGFLVEKVSANDNAGRNPDKGSRRQRKSVNKYVCSSSCQPVTMSRVTRRDGRGVYRGNNKKSYL